MDTEKIVAILDRSWEIIPIPFVLFYLIILGMIFLFIEYSITRISRATPGWRRPIPVLPIISELMVLVIRSSSWLLWIWALLYFILAFCMGLSETTPNFTIPNGILVIIGTWQKGFNMINGLIPEALSRWIY